jgi:hypothetical protein
MSESSVAAGARLGDWRLQRVWALGEPVAEAVAIALAAPLLLIPALWNGFPLTFYDTGAYLHQGLADRFIVERSPVYSFFLRFAGAGHSLWWIVILQAAMTAFVMVQTARALRPSMTVPALLGIAALLMVATGLPWYVGQIEPDCMAALAVLSVYLLAFHAPALGRARIAVLLAIAALATGAHPSHLGLTAGLAMCITVYWLVSRKIDWPRANIVLPASAFVLGLGLVLSANYHFTKEIFVSRAGPNFEFARLIQDRIARRDLDAICPTVDLKLCRYRSEFPKTADEWLWSDSPFNNALGRFEGTAADSEYVVRDSLARFPWANLKAAVSDATTQFFSFATGDQIEPQAWILYPDLHRFIPGQLDAYMHSRQQSDEIRFGPINFVHVPMAWLGLLGMMAGLWLAIRARARKSALFFGFILAALLGNAAICGVMSNPHNRYQSRLIWLPVFALCLAAPQRATAFLRAPPESGT